MKESDLYEPVKDYFSGLGYSIYAEVEVPKAGGRIDVVAYNHPAAIAIELKQKLSFELIEQAMNRKRVFPLVYIAYPTRRNELPAWLIQFIAEQGIGVIEITKFGQVQMRRAARFKKPLYRKPLDWKTILRPEHQEWVPGGHAGGGYVTNYAITMKGVRRFLSLRRKVAEDNKVLKDVEWGGWATVADILEHCETHYATPKNSLGKALENFESDWCEVKRESGRLWFRHKEEL